MKKIKLNAYAQIGNRLYEKGQIYEVDDLTFKSLASVSTVVTGNEKKQAEASENKMMETAPENKAKRGRPQKSHISREQREALKKKE